ncbi:MAG: tail fiber domain-containing protein [Prevotella sp.]|nr:tail fiber domain-containing protein [Prevotella sp.]
MKKFIIYLVLTLPTCTFAQLKVDSLGHVSVGNNSVSYSDFSVGGEGSNSSKSYFGSEQTTMWIENFGNPDDINHEWGKGILVTGANFSYRGDIGVCSQMSSAGGNQGRLIGILGEVGNATSGYNYGVVGSFSGTNNGVGVLGNVGNSPQDLYVDGRYAGYFNGNVKVTGTINGTVISSSDIRLKKNVSELNNNGKGVLDKIENLFPVSYEYDMKRIVQDSDTSCVIMVNTIDSLVLMRTHYGLIAQELQKVYPDLVYENDNGYLSINYTELIPIMLQSIKELKAQVDEMRSPSAASAKAMVLETGEATGIDAAIADAAGMDQNVPNPFSGETDIAIYLPETIRTATLYIYDLSGKQVEQHAIEGRGNTTMTIHADRMDAGMYIYSLIADGKVVATKRMIVVR